MTIKTEKSKKQRIRDVEKRETCFVRQRKSVKLNNKER